MTKFVQSLDAEIYQELEALAKQRGIKVQALIRQFIAERLIEERRKRALDE